MNPLLGCCCFLLWLISGSFAIDLSSDSIDAWETLTNSSQYRSWPNLSRSRAAGLRAQRDVAANISIVYNVVAGINLNTVVFDTFGYNETSLRQFRNLLNVGIQTFVVDLYYNEDDSNWGLCSKEMIIDQLNTSTGQCDASTFNISSLVTTLNEFIVETNNVLSINVLYLMFRLNAFSFNETYDNNVRTPNNLSTYINNIDKVVSPLVIDPDVLPTLTSLLFKYGLRVFPIVVQNNLSKNTSYNINEDMDVLYVATDSPNPKQSNYLTLSFKEHTKINCQNYPRDIRPHLQFSYDSNDLPFTYNTYPESIGCGFSPILNHRFHNISELSNFLELSLWSWGPYQPTITDQDELDIKNFINEIDSGDLVINSSTFNYSDYEYNSNGNNNDQDDDEYLNRCAALTKIGWIATSCDRKMHALCQNKFNVSEILITDDKISYMKADVQCQNFNGDTKKYELAVPRDAVQQTFYKSFIGNDSIGLWVNLNSLSSENCWVVGVNTNCPYQIIVSKHIFATLISVSTVMAFLLFLLLIYLQFQRLPVHKNRKYWRKLLNERAKNNHDGVPS